MPILRSWTAVAILLLLLPSGLAPVGAGPAAPPRHAPTAERSPAGAAVVPLLPTARPRVSEGLTPGDRWANLTEPGGPTPRSEAQMAFDAATNTTYLFGGRAANGSALNDTWVLSGGNWTDVSSSVGPAPPARWGAGIVYDTALGEFFLFGGRNATAYFGDTWTLNASGWAPYATLHAPSPRSTSLAYDERSGFLFLYGGANRTLGPTPGNWTFHNDTWELRPGSWLNLTPSIGPGPNATGSIVYDAGDRAIFLLGGAPAHNRVWLYSRGHWHETYSPGGPPAAYWNESLTYDAEGGFVLAVGANSTQPGSPALAADWAYRANQWTNLTQLAGWTPGVDAPPLLPGASMANDPADGASILFGGLVPAGSYGSPSGAMDTTWAFTGVPFRLNFSVGPNATDDGATVYLNTSLAEAQGAGFNYTYRYGHLPVSCTSLNTSQIACTAFGVATYPLNVTVTRSDGMAENASASLEIVLPPTANITPSSVVGDPGERFDFAGSVANGTAPFRFAWQFGDGAASAGTNASHAFGGPGVYEVNLTVTDSAGDTSTASVAVTVHSGLGLELTANRTTTDVGLPVGIVATPLNGTSPYVIRWEFPNGSGGLGASASPVFSRPGNYRINATVTDGPGATSFRSLNITVAPRPAVLASAAVSTTDVGAAFELRASAENGSPPFAYAWSYSDGTVAFGNVTSHAFAQPGPAWAQVTVTDAVGVPASHQVELTVLARPSVTASVTSGGCGPPRNASFAASVSGGLAPATVVWSFGDGGSASGAVATHDFADYGRYTVWANVTDAAGESSSSSLTYAPGRCAASVVGNASRGGGWSEDDSLGALALVGIAVVVAALLLRRRRRGEPSDLAAAAAPSAAGEPVAESAPSAPVPGARPEWAEDDAPAGGRP